jgi:phosphomannomutase
MTHAKHIFKAYDIRGLIEEITEDLARDTMHALIQETGAKRIVLGVDMRSTSEALARAAAEKVIELGAELIDIGLVSSSVFNFAVDHFEADAGLMVTASHNPAEYNGLKTVRERGLPVSGVRIGEIIQNGLQAIERGEGSYRAEHPIDTYLDTCLEKSELEDASGMKVVFDYGNGMGAATMPKLAERLGLEAQHLYAELDASFPNHEANPAKFDTLQDLQEVVVKTGAALGVATDGDGDRIGFVDETGKVLRGDEVLALLARHLKLNKVTAPVNVGGTLSTMNIEQNESRIGWAFVTKAMRESGTELGGEVSGHFFFADFSYRESIDYALLLILELLQESGKSLSELRTPFDAFVNSGEINTEVDNKDAVLRALRDEFESEAESVNSLDGLRFNLSDSWFIVRPSNTEPVLRLIAEAPTDEGLQKLVKRVRSIMQA